MQNHARSHTTRAEILALIARDGGRSLDLDDLRRELPGEPPPAVVHYHLTVLGSADLLPSRPAN